MRDKKLRAAAEIEIVKLLDYDYPANFSETLDTVIFYLIEAYSKGGSQFGEWQSDMIFHLIELRDTFQRIDAQAPRKSQALQ